MNERERGRKTAETETYQECSFFSKINCQQIRRNNFVSNDFLSPSLMASKLLLCVLTENVEETKKNRNITTATTATKNYKRRIVSHITNKSNCSQNKK